ncbi:proline iminopeptidase [Vagococcus xieshaowenii]|uniref:Proline iminopeptidase n=1 Tax=Vagococcus xieshaowenii TaxID=2562451 RepID=A0AAJ5EFM3_9ENTE|nr:proline iminopeptidase-family hydrolase [Vagococcus xieshaowenii]QCA28663.1 alpha/beta fold hydrolase [Vagococcus xieshaowenii]TFZ40530.1 alpha/beta fold hydrolase [Vagococcus xieshaowenii]
MKVVEGFMPFKGLKTYYRIIGEKREGKAPLILIHGGPGSSHNYFELLDSLAEEGHQLIMYDQIGCGQSPAKGRVDLFNLSTWKEELIALRQHLKLDDVHLLGQSWGGMLVIAYLIDEKPEGVRSAIFSSTLSSANLWKQEQERMIRLMTEENQMYLLNEKPTDPKTLKAYQKAEDLYMLTHASGPINDTSPEPLRRPKHSGKEAYITAWGPNEFSPKGNLKDFDYTEKLKLITVPVLITSGVDDLSTPLINKTMYDHLSDAKWELFAHSRHMPFSDETKKYQKLLNEWLLTH